MPRYEITSPDGGKYEINAPDGATNEQVMAYAQSSMQPAGNPSPEKTWGEAIAGSDDQAGIARTALDQSLQGATFGFADEVTDRLGAVGASLVTGEKYGDLLKEARTMSKGRMGRELDQRPALSVGANLAGALLTGGAGATTKAGATAGNFLRSGNLAARAGKSALAGATSGGAYGAGTAEEGHRLEGAGEGAAYGAAFGAALPVAGAAVKSGYEGTKNVIAGAGARNADELAGDLSKIESASSAAYQKMRDSGAVLSKDASQSIVSEMDDALRQSGPLNRRIHGNTISVMNDLRKAAKSGDLGLEQLDQYRRLFGDMAGDIGNKSNARISGILRGTMDDALNSLEDTAFKTGSKEALDALKTGRAEYSRARKFEMISDIVRKSEGDANYVKRELTKIVNNPRKARAFNQPGELDALKQAARLSGGEAILKIAGKFGFDPARLGSGVGAIFGSAGGAVIGGTTGAGIVPAAGTAARYGQKLLTRGKAENLLRVIEQGAANVPARTSGISGATLLPGIIGGMEGAAEHQAPTKITINPAMQGKEGIPNVQLPQVPDANDIFNPGVSPPGPQSSNPQDSVTGSAGNDDLINKFAQAESGGNPNARNPDSTSTASGLLGFTDSTWKSVVDKYGKKYGVTLADKDNPEAQKIMGQALMNENGDALRKAFRVEPTPGMLYLAHFAGCGGAKRLLKAQGTGAPAARLLPEAAKQPGNRTIFYDGKRLRSVDEVISIITSKV